MTPVINCEREALEFSSVNEYSRETQLPTRDAAVSMSSQFFSDNRVFNQPQAVDYSEHNDAPKSDELEALWPGVHHDFGSPARRSPSFFLTIGFMAGAAISLVGVFIYAQVSHVVASNPQSKSVMVASGAETKASGTTSNASRTVTGQDGSEILVPATSTYQVQTGDTLAAIAMRSYKRVSPRLLDEICKVNNMRNANVLSLGQKLTLPEYHPQANQVASTNASIQ